MIRWSKIDEDNNTVTCCDCGEVLGYAVVCNDALALRCLECGPEEIDE